MVHFQAQDQQAELPERLEPEGVRELLLPRGLSEVTTERRAVSAAAEEGIKGQTQRRPDP